MVEDPGLAPPTDTPPMPEWAPSEGPWCLRAWLGIPSLPGAGYTLCLLQRGHDGRCRDQHGIYHEAGTSLPLGDQGGGQG